MTDLPVEHGTLVTYLLSYVDTGPVAKAIAIGPVIEDPLTEQLWIPVLRADCTPTLVDPALIVDITPTAGPPTSPD